MIFITGGEAQGKRSFAAGVLGAVTFADGGDCQLHELPSADCITNYHLLVKRITENGGDPMAYTERLCNERPDIIVIMNEIGCGIVPIEKNEIKWREDTGRCGCMIAGKSGLVIRMVCGLPAVIKGELP